jgi:hypothetical protein
MDITALLIRSDFNRDTLLAHERYPCGVVPFSPRARSWAHWLVALVSDLDETGIGQQVPLAPALPPPPRPCAHLNRRPQRNVFQYVVTIAVLLTTRAARTGPNLFVTAVAFIHAVQASALRVAWRAAPTREAGCVIGRAGTGRDCRAAAANLYHSDHQGGLRTAPPLPPHARAQPFHLGALGCGGVRGAVDSGRLYPLPRRTCGI